MPFLDRRVRRGPGRFLHWKMRLLAVGAVLLLVGMARELDLLVIVAATVLAIAFILRFFEKDDQQEPVADGNDGDASAEDGPDWVPRRRATDAEGAASPSPSADGNRDQS
ncbi:MAG TPA: hypothetical protein VF092_23370 [Longimicrobium sp.]